MAERWRRSSGRRATLGDLFKFNAATADRGSKKGKPVDLTYLGSVFAATSHANVQVL